MSIIHMETEQVSELASRMVNSANAIYDKGDAFRHSAQGLQNNWDGGRSDGITSQIRNVAKQMNSIANQMDDLAIATQREVKQWIEVDANKKNFLPDMFSFGSSLKNIAELGGWAYVISQFHNIPTRPGSVPLHGPGWLLKYLLGIDPNARIMTPETLGKTLTNASLLSMLTTGLITGINSYLNGEYAGTSRAIPAAIVDAIIKGIAAAVVTAIVGALATLVVGSGATIGAAIATILICVAGSMAINALIIDPLFKSFQGTEAYEKLVEWTARQGHQLTDYLKSRADWVRNNFNPFISPIAYFSV